VTETARTIPGGIRIIGPPAAPAAGGALPLSSCCSRRASASSSSNCDRKSKQTQHNTAQHVDGNELRDATRIQCRKLEEYFQGDDSRTGKSVVEKIAMTAKKPSGRLSEELLRAHDSRWQCMGQRSIKVAERSLYD
jgi:hypothetical protein